MLAGRSFVVFVEMRSRICRLLSVETALIAIECDLQGRLAPSCSGSLCRRCCLSNLLEEVLLLVSTGRQFFGDPELSESGTSLVFCRDVFSMP